MEHHSIFERNQIELNKTRKVSRFGHRTFITDLQNRWNEAKSEYVSIAYIISQIDTNKYDQNRVEKLINSDINYIFNFVCEI